MNQLEEYSLLWPRLPIGGRASTGFVRRRSSALPVTVGWCHLGRGIFATRKITQGELIGYFSGTLLSRKEMLRAPDQAANSVQIGPNSYVDPGKPFVFTNHSCSPSAGLNGEMGLVALREIYPNEEVTFDYSTCMLERMFELECRCGMPTCRGVIQDFDRLPVELQKKYLSMGVVQPFIVSYLQLARCGGRQRTGPELPIDCVPDPQWLLPYVQNDPPPQRTRSRGSKARSAAPVGETK